MESMFIENLFGAMGQLFNVTTLLIILLGVVIGLFLGILPGIGGTAALAITFPITYDMTAGNGILFLIAVYSAAEYGGSIPAILINTPGTGAAAATILDGYPLSQKGFPRKAMQISLISGVFGGIFSTLIFISMGPLLAWVGLQFGPIEMFAVGVFGLSIVCSLWWEKVWSRAFWPLPSGDCSLRSALPIFQACDLPSISTICWTASPWRSLLSVFSPFPRPSR